LRFAQLRINQTSLVANLAASIVKDGAVSVPFSMSAGFPPKDITELDISIKDAGLVGASVMLKAV
jgi:hypothetical protein